MSANGSPPSSERTPPILVGLFGVPGCGKTTLLDNLRQLFGERQYAFYEILDVCSSLGGGSLEAYTRRHPDSQYAIREQAINLIEEVCERNEVVGIVTCHFSYWYDKSWEQWVVMTQAEKNRFTHILYLEIASGYQLMHQRGFDTPRARTPVDVDHFLVWQDFERSSLRRLCLDHNILFCTVNWTCKGAVNAHWLIQDFCSHNPEFNIREAKHRVDGIIVASIKRAELKGYRDGLKTVLILDADSVLIAEHTRRAFWEVLDRYMYIDTIDIDHNGDPARTIFGSQMGYSYMAFRQAMLLYEEVALRQGEDNFKMSCDLPAKQLHVHWEFRSLLQRAAQRPHVAIIVITSGPARIWETNFRDAGLSNSIKILGGGRLRDGCVFTPEVKGILVDHIRHTYDKVHVVAFGARPVDLLMLTKADTAIVVVGKRHDRNSAMEGHLEQTVRDGHRARQVLIPHTAPPRLDTTRLPLVHLNDPRVITSLLDCDQPNPTQLSELKASEDGSFALHHATDRPAAQLLATPTRNAEVSCQALRTAHIAIGRYLATEFVTSVIGLEPYEMTHVEGNTTNGYRLAHESATTIIAMLPGGEAMALGVSETFPLATLVLATTPADIEEHHVKGQKNIIVVDFVVNTGAKVAEFVNRLRDVGAAVEHVVVVAGVATVVQADDAVSDQRPTARMAIPGAKMSVVALRLSEDMSNGK